MARDELKKRIEMLNKRPMRNVPEDGESPEIKGLRRKLSKKSKQREPNNSTLPGAVPAPDGSGSTTPSVEPMVYQRTTPTTSGNGRAKQNTAPVGPPVSLEEAVSGTLTQAPCGPGYYLIEKPASVLKAQAGELYQKFVSLTGHIEGDAAERIAAVCRKRHIPPEEILFLDLETTGLSMTPVFLIGTMECTQDGFNFKQYFARDYSEESSILSAASDKLARARMLVTFNGKSFDVPFLNQRAIATGVDLASAKTHLDLLHEARKLYKSVLPNCRLQTLEQHICGRCRENDIPGAEIPEAYHEFVRTGNANKIGVILLHNLYDLLTMADLMCRMWQRD